MSLSLEEKKELFAEFRRLLQDPVEVAVETCRDDVSLPVYKHEEDAGMDVCAAEDIVIYPGETKVVPTGLMCAIPEGYEIQVRPRSGISLNSPLRISNSPGTIDGGYRNEIGVIVSNDSMPLFHNVEVDPYSKASKVYTSDDYEIYELDDKRNLSGAYHIAKGDRIAQLVLCEYKKAKMKLVKKGEVVKIGTNRGGGFGHSGVK